VLHLYVFSKIDKNSNYIELAYNQAQKREKALGAMPKGPFIDGNYQFLGCANFENVRCLSKGMIRKSDILLFI